VKKWQSGKLPHPGLLLAGEGVHTQTQPAGNSWLKLKWPISGGCALFLSSGGEAR